MKDKAGFDLLSEDKIKSVIKTELFANKIYAFWSVGSTNEFAYARAMQGEAEGALVIAEQQLRGRGRKSRLWDSPFNKGLWFSLILRPQLPAARAGLIPFLAGVSIAEAIQKFVGLAPSVKWPNDLLLNGKKFCGILSEVEFQDDLIKFIILGIGINVHHKQGEFPEEFQKRATSLQIESNLRLDRSELLAEIMLQLEEHYKLMKQNGFKQIITNWKKRCPHLGKEVTIIQDDEKLDGIFEDLNDEGCLLLRTKEGELKKIITGDLIY
jgi:BirA family biotin operon repressor/biotin-[acetyl-CoA-carboxylase] ligase